MTSVGPGMCRTWKRHKDKARRNVFLCGTDGAPLYTNMRDRLFGAKGVWNILRCKNASCDLLWLDPQPVPEDTGLLYAGSYYTHQAPVLSTFKRLSRSLKMNRLGTLIWSAMYHQGEKKARFLRSAAARGCIFPRCAPLAGTFRALTLTRPP